MLRPRITFLFAALALNCSESSAPSLCGPDGHYDEVPGARVCAYSQAIVIEGGFRCPAELPFRLDLEGAAICSDRMLDRDDLPNELCRRIDRTCGRSDGTPDAGLLTDAGACPMGAIEEGESCANEGQWCGGPCTDECSFCNRFRCEGGEWKRFEVFPGPCFDCGDEGLRCVADKEYCDVMVDGAPSGFESFACNSELDTCDGPPTCDCLALSPTSTCDDSGEGVIVRTNAP